MKRRESVQQSVSYEYNGVRYSRLEDMPPEVREHFIDRDGNGLPDSIDRLMQDLPKGASTVIKTERHVTRVIDSSSVGDPARANRRSARGRRTGSDVTLQCSKCGCDLTGSPVGGKCPECGQSVMVSIHQSATPIPVRQYPLLFKVIMEFPAVGIGLLVIAAVLVWSVLEYLGVL